MFFPGGERGTVTQTGSANGPAAGVKEHQNQRRRNEMFEPRVNLPVIQTAQKKLLFHDLRD